MLPEVPLRHRSPSQRRNSRRSSLALSLSTIAFGPGPGTDTTASPLSLSPSPVQSAENPRGARYVINTSEAAPPAFSTNPSPSTPGGVDPDIAYFELPPPPHQSNSLRPPPLHM
ncbi:hypothetical protein BOTBODRAFT_26143 [Botryobasidium botryosum FD-172 SS1]|uniref:Uncharacterized protein n=1 Tax=Botryobasidium botryosum (strain FD-172 SS1) TaxID=930990 RepID=A0A067N129_BOTB1|nr:hypothetical protein BOTBODRAFT_26143 [Botryobasidium botryosum FD-172 SS1]